VGVEPEQVLEEDRIAAERGVENATPKSRSSATSERVMAMTGVPRMMIMLVA